MEWAVSPGSSHDVRFKSRCNPGKGEKKQLKGKRKTENLREKKRKQRGIFYSQEDISMVVSLRS